MCVEECSFDVTVFGRQNIGMQAELSEEPEQGYNRIPAEFGLCSESRKSTETQSEKACDFRAKNFVGNADREP